MPNVGDELARKIVKEVVLFNDINEVDFSSRYKNKKLMSIGSVMHFAKTNDLVWGTGVNGKVNTDLHQFKQLDVRAVRGPRTRSFLMERCIEVPEIYGDPALLSSIFFPKSAFTNIETRKPFLVIPHMSEIDTYKKKFLEDEICSPLQHPYQFLQKILCADKIYSSSLHGIILAEAYGIPAVRINSDNGEDEFKYMDYYEGTNRCIPREFGEFCGFKTETYDQIVDLEKIQKDLISSFPYDFWNN
nr:polysaccharide pyruvyl transferase family protein [Acinetobacter sp. YH16040]